MVIDRLRELRNVEVPHQNKNNRKNKIFNFTKFIKFKLESFI